MSRRDRLNLRERLILRAVSGLSKISVGYNPPFLDEIVKVYGVREGFKRAASLEELVKRFETLLGERDGHIVLGYASLWNGCEFCSLGHVYAGNLAHFRDTGELFPLDEHVLRIKMREGDDQEILEYTTTSLPGHDRLRELLVRQFELKAGADPGGNEDDEMLSASIAAYDWLNHCSIYGDPGVPLVALSPLQKQSTLRRLYDKARGRG